MGKAVEGGAVQAAQESPGGLDDAHAAQELRLEALPLAGGEGILPLDYGHFRKTFLRRVRDHVIRNAGSQLPPLDVGIHRQGRQGLRWHSS